MKHLFRKIFLMSGAVGMLTVVSCDSKQSKKEEQPMEESKALSIEDMDTSIRPQDDFYQYATGGWQKNNPLPEEESRFGAFDFLAKQNSQKVKDIIIELSEADNEKGSLEWKIGTFYTTGMDSAKIESLGVEPILPEFEKIKAIENINDVVKQFAYNNVNGLGSLFYFFGMSDADNSEMNIAQVHQGGLGLPDRDYYLLKDDRSVEIRNEYVRFMTNMFVLLGDDAELAEKNANIIMGIETRLAENSMTRLEQREPANLNNKMKISEVDELTGKFDFNLYLNEFGMGNLEIINVRQPEFFGFIAQLMNDVSVDDWKTYFRWKLINSTSSYLSSDFDGLNFDFYGKFLRGQEKQKPRWRRMVGATNGVLGEAVGQKFVEKYFPADAKQRMETLVANLQGAFAERIKASTWMTPETQKKAEEKLSSMLVKIGYPDKWRDYSKLEITDSYVQNIFNSNRFDFEYMLSKIGKPIDKNEWQMNPQTVNAYYDPSTNEICFPAGILQPPFFYLDADDAVNYGAIGVVIGHEMTHGFDDQGRKYDKEGNLTDWWTAEDVKNFNEQAQVLVNRFDNVIVLDTVHGNGKLTLGENIADFGGLTISYLAFQNSLKGKEKPGKIDGFTPEQRFYLAYAKVWGQNIRDKEMLLLTQEDVHSLGKWRVNAQLPGIPAFHKAFDVKEGDVMYLPEEKWTKIW